MLDWFWENKAWFFEGLGAMAITGLVGILGRVLWKHYFGQDGASARKFHASAESMVVQSGGDIKTFNYYHTSKALPLRELQDLALLIWKANFPTLKEEAMAEAKKRVQDFIFEFSPCLVQRLKPEQLQRFREPEIQYSFNKALESIALGTVSELRQTLADLIIGRISEKAGSSKSVIYAEAIKTVG